MNIKTAVAGQGVKKFAAAKWGYNSNKTPSDIKPGDRFTFKNKNGNNIDIRLWKSTEIAQSGAFVLTDDNLEIPCAGLEVVVGDTIALKLTINGTVTYFTDLYVKDISASGNAIVAKPDGYATGTDAKVSITECSEAVLYADVNDADTWEKVATAVVKVLNSSALGYAKSGIVNNINSAKGTTIVVDPSAAFDYSIGDKVAVVRASKSVDNTASNTRATDDFFNGDSILSNVLTVTDINTFTGVITVNDALTIEITDSTVYQLINLSTTSATAYNAVSSETYTYKGEAVTKEITIPANEITGTVTLTAADLNKFVGFTTVDAVVASVTRTGDGNYERRRDRYS